LIFTFVALTEVCAVVQVVEGDIGEEGLGLSEEDRDLITSKVRVRVHLCCSAACIVCVS
jgi:hypothetical protein